ncbi:MAG: hypothetical protein HQM14_10695 [SAR324 cluster bacterium]|nr:hypothetical protein [SAR324 cluster bacterium]
MAEETSEKKNKSTEGGKKKRAIVNEHIFGQFKFLDDTDPKEGITHVKIESRNIGNIPGLIDHWKKDIEQRKKHILALEEQTFTQYLSFFFQKKTKDILKAQATGEEIYKLHPSKAAKEALKNLQAKPTDMMSRLELVSIVARSGRDLSPEVVRTLFLQATVALCLGELSDVGLNLVLWIQEMYFSKLIFQCKEEIAVLEKKVGKRDKSFFSKQIHYIEKRIDEIKQNWEIMLHYLQPSATTMPSTPTRVAKLNVEELGKFLVEKKDDNKQKERFTIMAAKIFVILRHLPLLHEEGINYLKLLKRIDSHEPIYPLLQAKINMSKLMLSVGHYKGGERTLERSQDIQEQFKTAYHQYSLAVRKIGATPILPVDYTILIEYANLVHYFYRLAVTILGIKLPVEWLETVFKKARDALLQAEKSGKTEGLYKEIHRDMVHAGLIDGIGYI